MCQAGLAALATGTSVGVSKWMFTTERARNKLARTYRDNTKESYSLCRDTSVVSHANGYNRPAAASGGIFKAALPRLTLRTMSLADFVQTNGLGLALLCSM